MGMNFSTRGKNWYFIRRKNLREYKTCLAKPTRNLEDNITVNFKETKGKTAE
jgi:hypothetical protein